jgi:hypothetical protein
VRHAKLAQLLIGESMTEGKKREPACQEQNFPLLASWPLSLRREGIVAIAAPLADRAVAAMTDLLDATPLGGFPTDLLGFGLTLGPTEPAP